MWQKKKSQSSLLRLWDRYKTQNTLMTIILMLGCTYTLVASLKGLLWNTSTSYSNSRNIAFGCVIGFLIYAAVNFLRVYQLSILRKDFIRIILSSRDIKPEEVRDEESFFYNEMVYHCEEHEKIKRFALKPNFIIPIVLILITAFVYMNMKEPQFTITFWSVLFSILLFLITWSLKCELDIISLKRGKASSRSIVKIIKDYLSDNKKQEVSSKEENIIFLEEGFILLVKAFAAFVSWQALAMLKNNYLIIFQNKATTDLSFITGVINFLLSYREIIFRAYFYVIPFYIVLAILYKFIFKRPAVRKWIKDYIAFEKEEIKDMFSVFTKNQGG